MVATHWNAELNMGSNLWNQAINDKHEANEKKKKIRNNRQQQVTIHLVYGAVVFDAFSVYLFGEEMHVGCVSKWKLLIEGFSKLNRRWKYTNGTHPSECRSRKKTFAVRTPFDVTRDYSFAFKWALEVSDAAIVVAKSFEPKRYLCFGSHKELPTDCEYTVNSSLFLFRRNSLSSNVDMKTPYHLQSSCREHHQK